MKRLLRQGLWALVSAADDSITEMFVRSTWSFCCGGQLCTGFYGMVYRETHWLGTRAVQLVQEQVGLAGLGVYGNWRCDAVEFELVCVRNSTVDVYTLHSVEIRYR